MAALTTAARQAALLTLFAVALPAQPVTHASAPAVRIALFHGARQLIPPGLAAFEKRYGKGLIEVTVVQNQTPPAVLGRAAVISFVHSSRELPPAQVVAIRHAIRSGALLTASWPGRIRDRTGLDADEKLSALIDTYFLNGGADNLAGAFALLYNQRASRKLEVDPPKPVLQTGVYHPEAPRLFPTLAEYLSWYRRQKRPAPDASVAGILMYYTYIKNGDMAAFHALIAEIEKNGMIPAAMPCWPPAKELPRILDPKNHPLGIVYAANFSFAQPEDARLLETLDVPAIGIMNTKLSYEQWKTSPHGITPEGIGQQVAAPERSGVTDPIVVAAQEINAEGDRIQQPIAERIQMAVARGKRYLALRSKPNREKRIAVLYFNNPPGKGNIGASYLHVPGTLQQLLTLLTANGYLTGSGQVPSEKALIAMLERSGRNVETWAPAELEAIAQTGQAVLVPMEKYQRWFQTLPKEFQAEMLKHWGPPAQSRLMTLRAPGGRAYFVIPGVRFGNIFLGPQPLKSSFEDAGRSMHDTAQPPHHVYVAAYLWMRHEFRADAITHIGRHGTLEFLPGKNVGQAGWDASEAILGDLPNPYYYIIDGGGESTTARRRSAGVMIGHLTPMLVNAGRQAEFDELRRLMRQWESTESDALRAEYARSVWKEVARLGLDKQLGLRIDQQPFQDVETFLEDTEAGAIPAGIHIVGKLPREELQHEALAEYLKKLPQHERKAAGDVWLSNLRASGERELAGYLRILEGRFQPSGMAGDPLRTPEALPSGRNLHEFDPTRIPTKEACAVGRALANSTLEQYRRDRGSYPRKISMVLWYGETARHQGALECQAMHLLGVEPVWNSRGVPDQLRLIPLEELKRPRVDVVYTLGGIYRDGFPDKVLLLDRATQLAASAEDGENVIAHHTRDIAAKLEKAGVAKALAGKAARGRAFAAAPGDYGAGISKVVKQSRDQEGDLANTYLAHMNHLYSTELWGEVVPQALATHLEGNQVVMNSRSSNVYGVLDNDDFYEFTGGLNAATKQQNPGAPPPAFLVADVRREGRHRMTNMKTFLATELNSRVWNPKWIREMQRGGYAGAREMADHLENLYGWQATSAEIMDGSFWQKSYDVYVNDKHQLGLKDFFDRENPHARQALLARMIEVDRQGSYRFSAADKARLLREFVALVNREKVACSPNTCGNRKLQEHVIRESRTLLSEGDVQRFEQAFTESRQVRPASTSRQQPPPHIPRKERRKRTLASVFDGVRMLTPDDWPRTRAVVVSEMAWGFALFSIASIALGWFRALVQPPPRGPEALVLSQPEGGAVLAGSASVAEPAGQRSA